MAKKTPKAKRSQRRLDSSQIALRVVETASGGKLVENKRRYCGIYSWESSVYEPVILVPFSVLEWPRHAEKLV